MEVKAVTSAQLIRSSFCSYFSTAPFSLNGHYDNCGIILSNDFFCRCRFYTSLILWLRALGEHCRRGLYFYEKNSYFSAEEMNRIGLTYYFKRQVNFVFDCTIVAIYWINI